VATVETVARHPARQSRIVPPEMRCGNPNLTEQPTGLGATGLSGFLTLLQPRPSIRSQHVFGPRSSSLLAAHCPNNLLSLRYAVGKYIVCAAVRQGGA